ncbi:hypothetical protein HPP92_022009 [Vanilla planifolia]|uniref:BHLH domain-containing protein n=1 Tax=Vanilla planifolia TaxID=51239 RepID=A0A835PND4_VANPL|nr:hypothetical protein HPP92_022333 [Vanilla planifolia]KAG0458881.1 hypothetical protein HPP92_022009 [Vanilla planifolia]
MVGEGLGGLCRGGGWTYGAIWRIDRRDPRLLVLEETYQEVQNGIVFEKLINQVHVIGQGTVGEVAVSGKHRWVVFDTYTVELSEISTIFKPDIFKGSIELQGQILAGIKTVAVISLPPLGVILFGSTQKICESSNFIGCAQNLLRQLGNKNHGYDHDIIACKQRQINPLSSECSALASGRPSLDSHFLNRSQTSGLKYCTSLKPLAHTSSGLTNGLGNTCHGKASFSSNSSCQVIDQQAALTGVWNLFSPNNGRPHSNFNFPNLFTNYHKSSTWPKEINPFYYLEHQLFPDMFTQGVSSVIEETSHSSVSKKDDFCFLWNNSALSKSRGGGSQAVMETGSLPSNFSEPNLQGADRAVKSLQNQHSPSISACGLATKTFPSQAFPFNAELPQNFLTSQGLNPENSTMALSNSKPTNQIHDQTMNAQIQSCELSDQLSNGPASSASYNPRDVSVASSAARNVGFPTMLPEAPVVCLGSSQSKGSNWNEKTSDAPSHLVSDNDLFDGMELDLSPIVLQQDHWDDIVLPFASQSCRDFSNSVADSISEFETSACGDKDLFSHSSFEELLDAVVAGNANRSSTCNSVRTSTNSDASADSRNPLPTITKPTSAQVNNLMDVGLSSMTQTPTTSLPEPVLENALQESRDDSQQKSRVRTWIDDCCSANAECSVINQHRQPEESAKVRKRARPGESTRPRPKDRQQIQDRIKELREIVPNGAKCSIDALLDRTIKHMLFLQSVTKYADKLNQAEEPKMIGDDSGVVLKDNTKGVAGGATWAYEVEGQTMVCPIIVEDVHPTGQMLVEMLCEERGFFLEIADVVRGFGLTILKGVMEIRERKVWARFIVEASKDVTRMDIFLSLVQLLQQTSGSRKTEQPTKAIESSISSLTPYQQSQARVEIALANRLQC